MQLKCLQENARSRDVPSTLRVLYVWSIGRLPALGQFLILAVLGITMLRLLLVEHGPPKVKLLGGNYEAQILLECMAKEYDCGTHKLRAHSRLGITVNGKPIEVDELP
jgi:hypothetical protein